MIVSVHTSLVCSKANRHAIDPHDSMKGHTGESTMKTPKKPGREEARAGQVCENPDPEQCQEPTRNDFNEEQMASDPHCGPVETEPAKPRDKSPGHVPGVI